MLVRTALLLVVLTSTVQAAAFDDLKQDLSTCLRFELDGVKAQRAAPIPSKINFALDRCGAEIDRLERADGRRLRSDGGLSPSTRAVIEGVFNGSGGGRARNVGMRY